MKPSFIKFFLLLFITAGMANYAGAQIATPEGEMQGGSAKDTANFVDKPSMHVHEKEIVISKKPLKSDEGSSRASKQHGNSADTAQATAANNGTGTTADTVGGMGNKEVGGGADNSPMPVSSATTMAATANLSAIYGALTALGIGALLGLFLLIAILRNQKTSTAMALLHGALGLVGIGMLIGYAIYFPGPVVAIVVLAIAATGGLIVFYKDIKAEPIPKWLAVTHGVLGLGGIVALIVFACCRNSVA